MTLAFDIYVAFILFFIFFLRGFSIFYPTMKSSCMLYILGLVERVCIGLGLSNVFVLDNFHGSKNDAE
jgi:hypothetical protein